MSIATAIPSYLPAITTAFTEGSSDLLERLSENLFGATFHGGVGSALVVASQEVIAESIAQVTGSFAVASCDGSIELILPDPTSILRQDNQKETGGDTGEQKLGIEPKSHSFESVEHLIENAGKLERTKHGKQGWIKGDPIEIFKNLADKHGAQIQMNERGVLNFKFDNTSVHLTGSRNDIPTLRIKSQGVLFKIRIM